MDEEDSDKFSNFRQTGFQPGSSTHNQAVISPVSGVLKVTERPGTMVEMACL
jgi:hypothetical protein